MDPQASGPQLMSGIQKYGRYESFKRFDDKAMSHANIGSKSMGKVNVDCQFLFKQSRWGMLDGKKFPAGIIYLNLNFGPPQGCRMKSATVTITLDEEAACLDPYRVGRVSHASRCPVQMTEWYGPRALAGQTKTADIVQTSKLTPDINVLGTGVGGLGFERSKAFTHSARWSFHGQLLPGKGTWTYKSLRWDLTENQLDAQSFHSTTVRTAFTFVHSGQPFLLKVDIDGKLEKWNDRIKSKMRFGTALTDDSRVTTLIDFKDYAKFQQNLDHVAKDLQLVMEMQNFQEIPVEVPDAIPGTVFQPAKAAPDAAHVPKNPAPTISTPLQGLQQPGGPALRWTESPMMSPHATISAQEFVQALHELDTPDTYEMSPKERTTPSPSTTAVGSERDATSSKTTEMTTPQEPKRSKELMIQRKIDEEAMSKVLEMPLIIMVLRLLASLMRLMDTHQRLEGAPKDASEIPPVDYHRNT